MILSNADGRGSRILLVGHGLMSGDNVSAVVPLADWAARNAVELHPLPVPAFVSRRPGPGGRPAPPQVAERLVELDELEAVFERIALRLAAGDQVIGLAASTALGASRSGRAWIDRVCGIADGMAGLALLVWAIAPDQGTSALPAVMARTAS